MAQIVALRIAPAHIFETSRTAIVQMLVLLQGGMIFDEFAELVDWRCLLTGVGVLIALCGSSAIQYNEELRTQSYNKIAPVVYSTQLSVGKKDVP